VIGAAAIDEKRYPITHNIVPTDIGKFSQLANEPYRDVIHSGKPFFRADT